MGRGSRRQVGVQDCGMAKRTMVGEVQRAAALHSWETTCRCASRDNCGRNQRPAVPLHQLLRNLARLLQILYKHLTLLTHLRLSILDASVTLCGNISRKLIPIKERKHWVVSRCPASFKTVLSFISKNEPFRPYQYEDLSVEPCVWWKGISRLCGLSEEFQDVVVRIHSVAASSASIERLFSSFGYVHSKIRNRLGVEKASKLVSCYTTLRDAEDYDWDC